MNEIKLKRYLIRLARRESTCKSDLVDLEKDIEEIFK